MIKEALDPCQEVESSLGIGIHSVVPVSSFAETSNSSMPLDKPHSQSLSSSMASSSTSPMLLLLPSPLSLHKPGWLPKRDDCGVRDNGVLAAVLGRVCNDVLLLCRADDRAGGKSRYGGASGDIGDVGEGLADGGDRRPGNEVKRGRMYESADGGGGGGGGGGFDGGNQSCKDSRARSGVTCLWL